MKKLERPRKIKVRKITTIILIHHYYLSSFPNDERKRELESGKERNYLNERQPRKSVLLVAINILRAWLSKK